MAITYFLYSIQHKVSGKRYIGKTKNLDRRWKEHAAGRGMAPIIAKAIAKYGADAFIWDILGTTDESEEEANDLERFYIRHHNTLVPFGYNLREGGEGGTPHPDTVAKIRAANLGRKFPEAFRETCRQRELGTIWSPGRIAKRSATNKRNVAQRRAQPRVYRSRGHAVAKYALDGSYIDTYVSAMAAADGKVSLQQGIATSCRPGERTVAGGFQWALTFGVPLGRIPPAGRFAGPRRVLQIHEDGSVLPFDTVSSAAQAVGVNHSAISNAIAGRIQFSGGFRWKYDDDTPVEESRPRKRIKGFAVAQYSLDGEYMASYQDAREAADVKGGGKTSAMCHIQDVARGDRRSACGYRWAATEGVARQWLE